MTRCRNGTVRALTNLGMAAELLALGNSALAHDSPGSYSRHPRSTKSSQKARNTR